MGAGGSSGRRASSIGALNGAPVFQQRCQDTSGALKGTKGVSVDDSYNGDFSDISYSEGGGLISHQDFSTKNGHFCNQHTSITPSSSTSIINPSTINHPFDPSPLPLPTPKNNLVNISEKENNLHQHLRHPHLPPYRVEGPGDTMSLCEGSVGVTPRGAKIQPRLKRAQSHDVRTSGHFFNGVNHRAGSSSSSNSCPPRPREEEKDDLVIERRTRELSFSMSPPSPDHSESPDHAAPSDHAAPPVHAAPPDHVAPPDHAAPPAHAAFLDLSTSDVGGSSCSSSKGSIRHDRRQASLPPSKGDMTVEEVA